MKGSAFHAFAGRELDEIFEYYERQVPGLGDTFVREVYSLVDRLVAYPDSGSPLSNATRVARVHRFPYDVFYKVEADRDRIFVLKISYQHRKPGLWKARL